MKILNVGSGPSTYGTDFVDLYPKRKEVVKCDVDSKKLPYKKETFDAVYSQCLFEHIKNHGFVLSEMQRVLKKEGKIILITDNAMFFPFYFKRGFHHGGYEGYGKADRHYALFTEEHLKNFFNDLNFKNIQVNYIDPSKKFSLKMFFLAFFLKLFGKRFASMRIRIEAQK